MTDSVPWGHHDHAALDELALSVGCEFELDAAQAVAAVVKVAPCPGPGVRVQREQWATGLDHHGYIDLYENRCERFMIDAGRSRIAYEAELLLTDPADVIEPDTPETPVAALPDEVLSFVMPSRFCLPDELGNEAMRPGECSATWRRGGGGCRRSLSSCTPTSSTCLERPIRGRQRRTRIGRARVCVVTTLIWRSRSAGR
jgi:hypothetical protein